MWRHVRRPQLVRACPGHISPHFHPLGSEGRCPSCRGRTLRGACPPARRISKPTRGAGSRARGSKGWIQCEVGSAHATRLFLRGTARVQAAQLHASNSGQAGGRKCRRGAYSFTDCRPQQNSQRKKPLISKNIPLTQGAPILAVSGFLHWLRSLDQRFPIANRAGEGSQSGKCASLDSAYPLWVYRPYTFSAMIASALVLPGLIGSHPCPGSERSALPYRHHQSMFYSANRIAPGGGGCCQ